MSRYPDVACDLWLINEWMAQRAWRNADESRRADLIAAAIEGERAGYGVPDDYTAGRRVHVFAADDCEVWIGCFDAAHVPPEFCGRVVMLTNDAMTENMIFDGGPYALLLDGRNVIGVYQHGEAKKS